MKETRFEFGKNWLGYLETIDEAAIKDAEDSLIKFTGLHDFTGKRFLDVGCGSGLFSLAAKRLNASVYSIDYDHDSVECTTRLKNKFFPGISDWIIEQGSILDEQYIKLLGQFDIVYSWGVLHHTGDMWKAFQIISESVGNKGILYIAIYNDQGVRSRVWEKLKKLYCYGVAGRIIVKAITLPYFLLGGVYLSFKRYGHPFKYFSEYKKNKRGMSVYYDWIDWLGGYPYEYSSPKRIIDFFNGQSFSLKKKSLTKGIGCNEFVFIYDGEAS